LIALCFAQMAIAALMLETVGKARGWGLWRGEDSEGYELVARWASGAEISASDQPALRYRLFNPIVPTVAGWLGRAIGLDLAFLAINAVCWVAGAFALRRFATRLWNPAVGDVAAVLFATSLPLIEWGLPMMLDAAAFAFTAGFLALWLERSGDALPVDGATGTGGARGGHGGRASVAPVLFGVLLGVGLLIKPPLLCLVIFATASWALERRWFAALALGACALLPPLALYAALGLTLEDFQRFGGPRHQGVFYLLSAAAVAFHVAGALALLQAPREPRARVLVWGAYALGAFATYLPFVHSPRLFFQLFAVVLPLAAAWIVARGAATWRWVAVSVLSSNALAMLHLFVMRRLQIRDLKALWESLS
jgi:hypothetical protein